ncbi:MAG: hypothetical protein C6Y22_28950 [Hapalosiphonaceae cyanobacterium JJU2]|nr:MAG: hypothetical protein C6Y22_28950 [Hapalosiphonaceae cyanobacterium JJU2]
MEIRPSNFYVMLFSLCLCTPGATTGGTPATHWLVLVVKKSTFETRRSSSNRILDFGLTLQINLGACTIKELLVKILKIGIFVKIFTYLERVGSKLNKKAPSELEGAFSSI